MCGLHEHHTYDDKHIFLPEALIPGVKRYRTSLKDVTNAVDAMFQSALVSIHRAIDRVTLADGTLDNRQRNRLLRDVGETVQGLFVAEGRFAFRDDGVTARTPFAQVLNEFYVRVVLEAIWQQRDWLEKKVPADVFQFLARAQPLDLGEAENPFLRREGESDEAFRQRLDDLRVFRPNPLAELDPNRQWVPMHRWQDSKGYRLSDRIWNTSVETRRAIDQIITTALENGWSAVDLAKALRTKLNPNAQGNAVFHTMRLARTEIARAANHAAFISAYLNPYVEKIEVVRSPSGDPNCPICQAFATIGVGGERLRPAYDLTAAMLPPFHPFCLCHSRPEVVDSPATVTMRLQAVMEDARATNFPPSVNPAAADALTQTLLHRALGTLVGQFRGQLFLPGF